MENFKEAVKDWLDDNPDFCREAICGEIWGDYGWDDSTVTVTNYDHVTFTEGTTTECVENFGGEGQGNNFYAVWKWTSGDSVVYTDFNGWYASHYGHEYEDWSFVEPQQKTITVYS